MYELFGPVLTSFAKQRVLKVRRKIEQKEILRAQAEMRTTRTRRQTRRPDYVYNQDFEDDVRCYSVYYTCKA